MLCEKNPCECIAAPAKKTTRKKPVAKKVSSDPTLSEVAPTPEKKISPKPTVTRPDMRSAMKAATGASLRPSMPQVARSSEPIEDRPLEPARTASQSPIRHTTLAEAIQEEPVPPKRVVRRMSKEDVERDAAVAMLHRVLGAKMADETKIVSTGTPGLGERITYLQTRIDSVE